MIHLETELFVIDVPELFEKVLQMGLLVRVERMDRAPDEQSFAELNLYVGAVTDEQLPLPADASASTISRAILHRHLAKERQLDSDDSKLETVEERSTDAVHFAIIDLPVDSLGRTLRQFIQIRGFALSNPPCFSSFVFEYDRAFDDLYRPLAAAMLASIEWSPEPFDAAQIKRQSEKTWSIFDEMPEERALAIKTRYLEIVRPPMQQRKPAEHRTVDLTTKGSDSISVEFVRDLVGDSDVTFDVRAPAFKEAVEVDIDAVRFDAHGELAQILKHLARHDERDRAEAARHAWAHCKICFEATDYGAPEGESNGDYFEIRGPDDALANLGKGTIYIGDDEDDCNGSLFGIGFYPPWEYEHGCVLVVRDGRFVGWTDSGGVLDDFLQ